MPFNFSKTSYEEIFNKVEDSELLSEDFKDYLNQLNKTRDKWCYAFKKNDEIIGVQTTSRIESLHSSMKRLIRTKCSLTEMTLRLLKFAHQTCSPRDFEDNIVQDSLVEMLSKNAVLVKIQAKYTTYIYNKCLLHYVQSAKYKVTKSRNVYSIVEHENNQHKYSITLKSQKFECNCYFWIQWGIPCVHMFAIPSQGSKNFSKKNRLAD